MHAIDVMRRAGLILAMWAISAGAFAGASGSADALAARHAALQQQLAANDYGRPLHIESTQEGRYVSGEVFARVPQPFAVVNSALQQPGGWCDVLIMIVNIKQCVAGGGPAGHALDVRVGRKIQQQLDDTYRLQFDYRVTAASEDYLHVQLHAPRGPLGTNHYRISFEAVALDAQHSFVRIAYGYEQGLAARLATRTYLATAGSAKVGFSVVGRHADGRPILVKEMRGVIERNAMRCYLAVEAYLGAQAVPESLRLEKRLQDWHMATEQYAQQLRELGRNEYLELKRSEVARQEASQRSS